MVNSIMFLIGAGIIIFTLVKRIISKVGTGYNDEKKTKVKIYKRVLKNKIYGWLFFVELLDEDKVEFYVPDNTVINNYKIDLQ